MSYKCAGCGGEITTSGHCNGFVRGPENSIVPCSNNVVRLPSIANAASFGIPSESVIPCPACSGTGRLRTPKPGEMVDVDPLKF